MIKTSKRNKKINIKDINTTIFVENGKTKIKIKILNSMLNHRIGEFIKTKKKFVLFFYSKLNLIVVELLKKRGFIRYFTILKLKNNKKYLHIFKIY